MQATIQRYLLQKPENEDEIIQIQNQPTPSTKREKNSISLPMMWPTCLAILSVQINGEKIAPRKKQRKKEMCIFLQWSFIMRNFNYFVSFTSNCYLPFVQSAFEAFVLEVSSSFVQTLLIAIYTHNRERKPQMDSKWVSHLPFEEVTLHPGYL